MLPRKAYRWRRCVANGWMVWPVTDREYNRLRAKQWRENNPENARAIAARYYQRHKAQIAARKRAKRREKKLTD